MKKIGIYSFLVAAVLFTGCSQKNVEMDGSSASQENQSEINNSEATLDNIDNSNIQEEVSNDTLSEKAENGYYYMINGEKVFIENIYFGFDKYKLDSNMIEKAKDNAQKLSGIKETTKIKIEGNCDEWGTDEYNYALGLKRAKATKDALISEGINEDSISLVSFGESNPVCNEKNKNCWQKNRRAEHKLLP
ncbi:hypothetical protein CPG37_08970 [Malaciobacter canalis]|jgi:peptidoglycan-associated lipoprotein|uniref:Peptidoglycan-associated lipoprotein n=2 Tax=Malaciobacter TaxID=2321114 RepID=A0AB36ZW36_9BACT|nr:MULTISPECIES: OmpA family protein [Malaciobacter]PHO09400.1 hypothetical protein CPG37_08970 [Malaciobacter canalis]PPK60836.1 peptidoglycan-associated lipoprotein [Malaciobacter marinus]QEE33523.1 Tol-Pal system peptidoglycan-associated lipoprotein [Malaciobacter canalis]SKB62785.1 peptidoglycan-associated lipoprotein [Malaciobacter marinus]